MSTQHNNTIAILRRTGRGGCASSQIAQSLTNWVERCDGPSLGCRQKCGFGPKAQRQSEGLTIYVYLCFQYPGGLLSL